MERRISRLPLTTFYSRMIGFLFGCLVLSLVQETPAEEPAKDPVTALETVSTAGRVLTLSDTVELVLRHSPRLMAYSFDVRAAEARQIQAALRPNPELSLEIEDVRLGDGTKVQETTRSLGANFSDVGLTPSMEWGQTTEESSGDAFSEAELTLSLSQVVELGGKRAKRMTLAAADREMTSWDYEIARANILEETAEAFVDVLVGQQRVLLSTELVTLAEQVFSTVSARVQAGRVSPLEAKKAETALASARLAAERSRRDLLSYRSQLAALWGENLPSFELVEGTLEKVRQIPGIEDLLERIEENPDLARWKDEMEKRDAVIASEKAKALPDLTVSAGLRGRGNSDSRTRGMSVSPEGFQGSATRSEADDDWDALFMVGVSVPLPLFDRNQGSIKEAEVFAAKAAEERRASRVSVQASLVQIYQDLSNAYSTIQTLKSTVLPAATETFSSIDEAYKQGKFGFLDVLDAQRTLFEARKEYLDALADYHRGVAMVERLIGATIWQETLQIDAQKGE